jgi:hypothetical protein
VPFALIVGSIHPPPSVGVATTSFFASRMIVYFVSPALM